MKFHSDLYIPDHGVYPSLRICRVVAAVCIVLVLAATWVMQGCSTRTLIIHPDGTVNASVTAIGYCPEATVIRAGDVEMLSEASGVGAVVQSLGHDAVEVMR